MKSSRKWVFCWRPEDVVVVKWPPGMTVGKTPL